MAMAMCNSSESDLEFDVLDEVFAQASEYVERNHDTIDFNDLLEFYALYKQGTVGRCNTAKPSVFHLRGKAKWSAWNNLGDMEVSIAKRLYAEKLDKLRPDWNDTKQRYKDKAMWVVHSVELPPPDIEEKADHEKTVFDHVKDGNLQRLRDGMHPTHLNALDEQGMGLIHWASDRNFSDILQYLLSYGADVNFRDADHQTALHYAVCCSHLKCVRILLDANADRYAKDSSGQTCYEVADSDEIRALLET